MSSKNKQNNKITKNLLEDHEQRVLDNTYILGPCLLHSTTGDIYAAWDVAEDASYHLPSPFFIKFLPKSYPCSTASMQIFIEEIKRQTDCCDWCKIIAFGHENEDDYLVLQLPRGEFLGKKIETTTVYNELPDVLLLISSINKALETLKDCGLYHGRVEPASIFIDEKGKVGLLDTIYVSAKQRQLERGVDYTATIPNREAIYASPDICFGREVSPQDDVFSLACISYHLLSGQHPFDGANSVSALLNKIRPKRIETLTDSQWEHLEWGMNLVKENRIETVTEFINGFDTKAKPVKKKIKNKEVATARENAQNLIRKQAKSQTTKEKTVITSTKKAEKAISQAIQAPTPVGKMGEIDYTKWGWIPLSLLIGVIVGVIAMSLSISLLGIDFFSLINMLRGE